MDTHARLVEDQVDFLRGTMSRHMPVEFEVNGNSMNARLRFRKGEGFDIFGVPKHNSPGRIESVQVELERARHGAEATVRVSPRFPSHDFEKHKVSWLRAAYLVAFAALGYRYAARPELEIVRSKIRTPEETIIKGFHSWYTEGTVGINKVGIAASPDISEAVLVIFGQHLIILPLLENAETFYCGANSNAPEDGFKFSGGVLEWPSPPRLELDFEGAERGPARCIIDELLGRRRSS